MDEVDEIKRRMMMEIVDKQKKKDMGSGGKPVELMDKSLGEDS